MLNKTKMFIISLIIGAIVPSFLLSNTVFATDYSASITTSGDVELITVGGQTVIDHSDVNVVTNCHAGYNLSLGTTVNDNNLYLDGDSSNNATDTYITPSNGTSALKDAPNTWGYFASFGASPIVPTENNIFSPVPTLANDPIILRTPAETASASDIDDDFSIYYGANIRSGMQSGTYTMVPENPLVQDSNPGRLSYYLTMDMSCVSNVDVSFNKNLDGEGGESDPGETVSNFPTSEDNTIDPVNDTITLSDKRPLRTGYQFMEWNTEADGTGDYFHVGQTISIGSGSGELQGLVTLYAIWVEDCASHAICYHGNHADAGAMDSQTNLNANATIVLIPSNFSRSGYGFTGWNTEADGTGTQYGPNQNFTTPSTGGVNLYAQWLAPSGTLQSWSGTSAASNMNVGDVLALEDNRDGEVYMVAKLADGNIWITENLRLVPDSNVTITPKNTNNPTADFRSQHSSSVPSTMCHDDNATCDDSVQYNTNNINRGLTPSYNTNYDSSSWYSYGVMYNWYTATAGNGTYSISSGSVSGDLCPAGWHLPTGGANGEWGALNAAVNNGVTNRDTGLRAYPVNIIRSGDYNPLEGGGTGRGNQGRIWSTTAFSATHAYRMGYSGTDASATNKNWNKWDGFAIRCIYQGGNNPYYDVTVDFQDAGITNVTATSQDYPTETATPTEPIISLVENTSYTITATMATGYEFTTWATTTDGTLGSTTTNPTTYTIANDTTLTVASQPIPSYTVTTNLGEYVSGISFTNSDYGTKTITPASPSCTANQDNTYTCTVDLKRGVEYTISGTYESGYGFDAWTTGAGGTLGDASSSATTYSITSATTLSLTAKEAEEMTYTLIYHAGSGTDAPASETITSQNPSESFTITNLTPIYYGYAFTGWSETADANNDGTTVDYVSGDTITITGTSATNTKTLYPVYQAVATCPANNICYYDNGADVNGGGRGTMTNQSSNTTKLIPSNFSRTGYGFAGWTTAENATPFGPNATIDSSLVSPGLVLYAKWVKSEGDLQSWHGCNAMSENQVIALTDTRDNNVYAVAKLADGNCWTIENLRLDPGLATITAQNTHNPTSDFITESTTDDGSGNPVSLSIDTFCSTDGDANCINSIQYNTSSINRSLTPNKSASSSSWYSYGVYYNWYTATAGNGVMDTASGASVSGDICPKNWHLPTSTNSGEWAALNRVVNGGVSNADAGLRIYPVNLIWSGDYSTGRTSGYSNGRFWSSTGFDANNAYRMGHQESGSKGATPSGNYKKWDGFAVRCIRDEAAAEYGDSTVTPPTQQSSPSSFSPLSMDEPSTNGTTPQSTSSTSESNGNTTDPDLSAAPDHTNTDPQGVTNITTLESPTPEDDPNAGVRVGLAVSTAVATTTAGLLLVFARHNKDDDEEEEQQ